MHRRGLVFAKTASDIRRAQKTLHYVEEQLYVFCSTRDAAEREAIHDLCIRAQYPCFDCDDSSEDAALTRYVEREPGKYTAIMSNGDVRHFGL